MQENNPALLCGDVLHQQCPSREILNHPDRALGGVGVRLPLSRKTHRFSRLKQRITGISEKMLSQTLRELERDGFVHREVFPEVPPRVEYSLTPLRERWRSGCWNWCVGLSIVCRLFVKRAGEGA